VIRAIVQVTTSAFVFLALVELHYWALGTFFAKRSVMEIDGAEIFRQDMQFMHSVYPKLV